MALCFTRIVYFLHSYPSLFCVADEVLLSKGRLTHLMTYLSPRWGLTQAAGATQGEIWGGEGSEGSYLSLLSVIPLIRTGQVSQADRTVRIISKKCS